MTLESRQRGSLPPLACVTVETDFAIDYMPVAVNDEDARRLGLRVFDKALEALDKELRMTHAETMEDAWDRECAEKQAALKRMEAAGIRIAPAVSASRTNVA